MGSTGGAVLPKEGVHASPEAKVAQAVPRRESKGTAGARGVGHHRKTPVLGFRAHVASDAEPDMARAVVPPSHSGQTR
jgi:hypothetical protein